MSESFAGEAFGGEQFTMLLSQEHCRALKKRAGSEPLRFIYGGHNRRSDFSAVQPGDGMWLLRFEKGEVFLMAHVVAGERMNGCKYLQQHPEDAPLIPNTICGAVLLASSSSELRFDRAIPAPIVERMRFKIGARSDKTRKLKNFEDGRLKNEMSLAGVFRLAEDSVRDLRDLMDA